MAFARSDIGSCVLKIAPPTFRCGSSASRAMKSRMISLEPSEDRVYATIAKESFHRDWRLAAASAANAQFHSPGRRAPASRSSAILRSSRSPHFATSRFRCADRLPYDRAVMSEKGHSLPSRKRCRPSLQFFQQSRRVCNRHAPLNAFRPPICARFRAPLGKANAGCGQCESPYSNVVSATFNPAPSLKMMFSRGMRYIREFFTTALYSARQPHEPASISDLQPRRVHINDERCDLLALLPPTIFDGVRAITTSTPAFTPFVPPKFFRSFSTNSEPSPLASLSNSVLPGRSPAMNFGQRDAEISPPATRGRYFCFCSPFEQNQRLRDTDRLMRRNKRSHVSIPAPKQNCGASVIGLRQTKAAIFFGTLIPNAPISGEPFEIFGREFRRWRSISSGSTCSRR